MNARLTSLLNDAEARLSPAAQDDLADLLEVFVTTHRSDADFTPEELADLRMLDAEPFLPADPVQVAALFTRRG